jgi:hypothetical protein
VAQLQPLLAGVPLNFAITQNLLDQVAPGLHRMRIKDVALQIDFDVPAADQVAIASVLDAAASIAGGAADPALDGRIPGGGFPALPVVTGRIPTGIPAALCHGGTSRIRIRPSPQMLAAYYDECGDPVPSRLLPGPLRRTRMLPDPDPEAHAAGWRTLEIRDRPQCMLFSHFERAADTVRFISPPKQLKPFEHRAMVGDWSLEVPALVLGSVVHQLPQIRDVRLIFSAEGQYDSGLASLLALPPVPVSEPPVPTALPVALPPTIEALLQQLTDATQDVTDALEGMVANLGAGVDGLVDVYQALTSQTLSVLAGAMTTPTSSGTVLQPLLLSTNVLTNEAQVLAGTAAAAWTVNGTALTTAGVDPARVVRVVSVVISPVTNVTMIGGAPPVFPVANGTLGFTPAATGTAVATPVSLSTTNSTTVPGSNLAAPVGSTLASPVGQWTLQLPTGMSAPLIASLTEVLVGLLLEVTTP